MLRSMVSASAQPSVSSQVANIVNLFFSVALAAWIALSVRLFAARFSVLFPAGIAVLLVVTRLFPYGPTPFSLAALLLYKPWIFQGINLTIETGFAVLLGLLARAAQAQRVAVRPEPEEACLKNITPMFSLLSGERIGAIAAMMVVGATVLALAWGANRYKGPRIDQSTGLNTRSGEEGTPIAVSHFLNSI